MNIASSRQLCSQDEIVDWIILWGRILPPKHCHCASIIHSHRVRGIDFVLWVILPVPDNPVTVGELGSWVRSVCPGAHPVSVTLPVTEEIMCLHQNATELYGDWPIELDIQCDRPLSFVWMTLVSHTEIDFHVNS